jgi:hypothetical protein
MLGVRLRGTRGWEGESRFVRIANHGCPGDHASSFGIARFTVGVPDMDQVGDGRCET